MQDFLGNYINEYSVRNKSMLCQRVYSVTNSRGFVPAVEYFSKEVFSKDLSTYKVVKTGMIAYNPSRVNVGSIATLQEEEDVIISPLYVVFETINGLLPEYVTLFLKSNPGLFQIRHLTAGSVRDTLSFSSLCKVKIPILSIDEQRECIKVAESIEKITALKQGQLQRLNEITSGRFVEMFGDVVQNNKRWKTYKLSDISTSRLGKMVDAKQQTGKCSYPYLANFNVQWFRFDLTSLNQMDFDEKDQIEFNLQDGDLMVCEGGEIGRCAVWHNELQPCFYQKAVHRVRCNSELIQPDYLAWWFKFNCDHEGFSTIAKATIAHLTGVKLKQLNVVVPPLNLQKQFADFIVQVDKSKVVIQASIDKLQLLFDSLMQVYFGRC